MVYNQTPITRSQFHYYGNAKLRPIYCQEGNNIVRCCRPFWTWNIVKFSSCNRYIHVHIPTEIYIYKHTYIYIYSGRKPYGRLQCIDINFVRTTCPHKWCARLPFFCFVGLFWQESLWVRAYRLSPYPEWPLFGYIILHGRPVRDI